MPAYRFATLLWQDAAGFHTAVPIEARDESWVGYGTSASQALEQLRDFLTWLHQRKDELPMPDLFDAQLSTVKVPVRPEYESDGRVYPGGEVLLPVHCVAGRTATGLLVAALPLLNVRFYYHEAAELKFHVQRYAQQELKGQTPSEIARFLPPPAVRLENVVVRIRPRKSSLVPLDDRWPALAQVAEPLGDRAVRKQYAPAWERSTLVAEVVQRLHHERTNLLLVGESGAGKTTVLVEAVQAIERLQAAAARERGDPLESPRTFWLTSAGRLIAGMKYLGMWEERCERVIDELVRMPGILCVDRLLDLLRLGGTGPGDSLAAFLVPYLQRGELRLVGEATPAELDACRRLLSGFADLFPVLHVPPFDRPQALAVLDRTLERHVRNLRLESAPGVSDRTYQLIRRFAPYQAFPGPAVSFLRDLCERHARNRTSNPLTPANVVQQFVRRTGLPDWLLRDEETLDHNRLLAEFRRQVLGQDEAVRAASQLVTTFKAGLNDPRRPIGVLLFCGPTGVGKTELARALARVLFGHGDEAERLAKENDRLVRLDMSEYAGLDAVDRLLGAPDGEPSLLIRRVRQQPFCVLLLDEIEKAGPEVFNVLLGVCDEGRLTDRFGRTTLFRSSVIVMTSNLGAERRETFGLGRGQPPSYADIARDFFRPEFFNRLDAVVTFQPLGPETIHAITRKELEEIGRRQGFQRVNLRLVWTDRLVDWLAREGFDARYGARPLQRVLEQRVVTPLARFLITHPDLRNTDVHIDFDDQGKVLVCV